MSAPAKAQTPDTLSHELWRIAEIGDVAELDQLLARGADVNARNNAGMTVLMIAACLGRFEMVRALCECGADLKAVDSQGFTAEMLADQAGYEDIVRTLVSRGVKKTSKSITSETPSIRLTQDKVPDNLSVSDVASTGTPAVRMLHDPPDIWNLVPESRVEFNPRSAFLGKTVSNKYLIFIVIVLIAGGGAVFGFMKLKGLSGTDHAASTEPASVSSRAASTTPAAPSPTVAANASGKAPLQTDYGITASSSPVSEPNTTTVTSNQQATSTSDTPGSQVDSSITVSAPSVADSSVPARRVASKRLRASRSTAIDDATLARTDDEDRTQTPATVVPKSGDEKAASPPAVKKEEEKTSSSQVIVPPRANATPKPKVIQWP
ncbi:MAG TPA: ankyrin repeat domain-containing protein [Pyrinomonadaceae bacterium]|nr:ankyrin repeat domain-containing protein [Pyrinomonadaceae bacterium]